jgi:cytosine/adenosine deaminase-related metal-dependent hydrolase
VPHLHRAAWVLPISSPPIRDGWVAVEAGRIVAVGGPDRPISTSSDRPINGSPDHPISRSPDHPIARSADERVILPGLANCHAHLELSWMRGLVPPAESMPKWAAALIALRRASPGDPPRPIQDAIRQAREFGTSLIGDVTNTLAACDAIADSALSATIFYELIGFNTADPAEVVAAAQARIDGLSGGRLRGSVVPHAPYSVSPQLLENIAKASALRVVSVHLAESREELQFMRNGSGPWRELLEQLGAWTGEWHPPGGSPVDYLARCGLLHERLLAVHCVQLSDDDLARLRAADATVVMCPRSNRWTGAGDPPVSRFYSSGVRVAIGTDSLASVQDLNVFAELAAARALTPAVPAAALLESATRHGADALGFGADLGTIEPGKRADLIAVRIPAGIQDVEEYLVGGIGARQIEWLDAT